MRLSEHQAANKEYVEIYTYLFTNQNMQNYVKHDFNMNFDHS